MGRHQQVWIPEPRRNTGGIMAVSIIGLAVLAAIIGGVYSGYDKKILAMFPAIQSSTGDPRALRSAHTGIGTVGITGTTLNVEARLATQTDDPAFVGSIGDLVREVGKRLQAGVDDDRGEVKTVRFRLTGEGSDRLGAAVETPLMAISFRYADMKAANFDRLTPEQALDLASGMRSESPTGAKALTGWCRADDNAADAGNFCALASRKAN